MTPNDEKFFFERIYPHFEKICTLSHPSHEETELVKFIIGFAEKHGFRYEHDKLGNVAIYRNASSGCEHLPPLLFQGHTDMVCVPDKNIFPIKPIISEGWIHTGEKSTLGADNGIAVAMMLEMLLMDFEKNPPLEFLFTVAEEVGLIGASNMEVDKFNLKATRLINVDSEDIKFITVGCAGAKNLDITIPLTTETCTCAHAFSIKVTGPGGHSGMVIHENIPNTIKIAGEIVDEVFDEYEVHISQFTGGFARNAIPAEASTLICSDTMTEDSLNAAANSIIKKHTDDQEFTVVVEKANTCTHAIQGTTERILLDLIKSIPHGVVKMNPDTGGVLSSNNLALVEQHDSKIKIIMSSRSCETSEIDSILDGISENALQHEGVEVYKDEGYPGWRPNMDSELLKTTTDTFINVFGEKPDYLDIHAGLECGILMNKFPIIKEAVSIGPNIRQVHSIKEKLEISSTVEIWNVLKELIAHYAG